MKCRLCRKEFKDGVGRFNDHILLLDEVTEAICTDCAINNPDAHHKAFLTATKGYNRDQILNFAFRKGKP